MDERERDRYERLSERTRRDRMDFIDAELRTGMGFAAVARSHFEFGERAEGNHARGEAAKALETASEAMETAREQGFTVTEFEERAAQLRSTLQEL